MPFASTNTLNANPDVRVFFSGQLILEPHKDAQGNSTGKCEVYVNRSAPDHYLSIEVRRKRSGKPDEIVMRHLGPLAFAEPSPPRQHGMLIRSRSAGVAAYNGSPTAEGESLIHTVDFESRDLHNGAAGPVDPLGGRPSILLEDGTLYTAERTPTNYTVELKKGGVRVKLLDPIARIIGANFYLNADESVIIQWRQDGRDATLPLEKQSGGASYEIYIDNDPLFELEGSDIPPHEEFTEYYKLLPHVKTDDRFELKITPPAVVGATPGDGRGSTVTPCMPTTKGG